MMSSNFSKDDAYEFAILKIAPLFHFNFTDSDVQCEIAATSVEFSEESSQHVLLTKLRNLLELNEMNDFEYVHRKSKI